MAVGQKKTRVMMTFNDELLERVDAYCGRYGITRSGFFAALAADKFAQTDATVATVEKLMGEWLADYSSTLEADLAGKFTPELLGGIVSMMKGE